MEILIVGVILIFVFNYVGFFSFNKFVEDNNMLFERLKEKDYEMEKLKEQQKKVLENNNAKVLKRGEYVA